MRLNCSAGGTPLPKVTWFKDGRRVPSTAVHSGNDLIKSELVVHRFNPNDTGVYTCLFYNEKDGREEANTSLGMTVIFFLCSDDKAVLKCSVA